MSNRLATDPMLTVLARHEIRNYLTNKVFWFSAVLWVVLCVISLSGSDGVASTTGDGILSAMALGVLGMITMAGLTRNSDRSAAAAGAVAVPQRVRTLALAAAVVVPGVLALVWFVCAVIGYQLHPPGPSMAPFGEHSQMDMYASMFAEGVTPAIGGPILGVVIARWLPRPGVAPLLAVVVVLMTVILQPLFSWADRVRLAWVWIHFYAPAGIEGDPDRFVALPGSPYFYIAYQLALCVLGVLVAVYRDPEADHARLRRAIFATLGVAALLVVAANLGGPAEREPSPVPSVGSGSASAS